MSNELNNIIARNSDGVYEGVAIGGDRYPGTRFIDHLLRYQDNPSISVRKGKLERNETERSSLSKLMGGNTCSILLHGINEANRVSRQRRPIFVAVRYQQEHWRI